ncbi:MAG: VOC family protein [Dehalococcoidia bacterium]
MKPPPPPADPIVHPWTVAFDRVTISVTDLEAAAAFLHELLGGDRATVARVDVGDGPEKAVQIRLPGAPVELIERPVAGIHHLAWWVDNLDALLAQLEAAAWQAGSDRRTAWLIPERWFGVRVELRRGRAKPMEPTAPVRGRVHHFGIGVPDGPPALERFRSIFGGGRVGPVPWGSFTSVTIDQGVPFLGFIYPSEDDAERRGFVARFVDERGPGVHHLAFDVWEMEEAIAVAEQHGVRLVNRSPAEGLVNDVFLHPSNPTGVLLRLTHQMRRSEDR